jgi:hypothetical protein
MLHLLSRPAAPDVGPAPSAGSPTQNASTPVLISEQEVVFITAAATLVPPASSHRHWPGTTLIAAIGRIHMGLPQPRPHHLRRDPSYFEAARMSREMDHL